MRSFQLILVVLLLAVTGIAPVLGVTTYLDSMPRMSAAIYGVNEFVAGDDVTMNVVVQNSGLSTMKTAWIITPVPTRPDLSQDYVPGQGSGTVERDDLSTTAKMVSVGLAPAGAPIIVRSDPRTVGDIPSQGRVVVPLLVKILADAPEGEYTANLTLRFTYLASSDQPASDILQSNYQTVSQTLPLTIKIKPQVKIGVISAVPESLNIGSEGYIDLVLQNIGSENGKKATVKILRNGASPIIPTDSNVYIGDFPVSENVSCRYKVSVSAEAEKQTYPVDVVVSYENRYGDMITSSPETVGIPVGGKIGFSVASGAAQLSPGSNGMIDVVYRNTGDATAHNAQVRMSAVDPFTSSDDTAFLGDVKPGETATARFQLSVNPAATNREYTLDTQVRYRDSFDNSQVSDTFKVPVAVVPGPAGAGIAQILPVVLIIAVIAAGAGYYLLGMRKKK